MFLFILLISVSISAVSLFPFSNYSFPPSLLMHCLLYLSITDITCTLHNISFTLQDKLYLVCLSYFTKLFVSISKVNFLKWQTGCWD